MRLYERGIRCRLAPMLGLGPAAHRARLCALVPERYATLMQLSDRPNAGVSSDPEEQPIRSVRAAGDGRNGAMITVSNLAD